MGKHRHSKDKQYITRTEYKEGIVLIIEYSSIFIFFSSIIHFF